MYQNEFDEFQKLIAQMCISVNRPCNDELIRVFWEDLKAVPLAALQRQATVIRVAGKKQFTSNDLRPPPEERSSMFGPDNHEIIARIQNHVNKRLWESLSTLQRLYKHEWVFTRDKLAPRCVAMRIHPDSEEFVLDGQPCVRDYPGHYIRYEDCVLSEDMPSPSEPQTLREAESNWNDADAARDLLNRKT